MRVADSDYILALHRGARIVNYARFTLTDGTIVNLTPADFRLTGNSFTDKTTDGNSFSVGSFIGKIANICIDNSDGRFDDYDFYMSQFTLDESIAIDENTVKSVRIGSFTVVTDYTPGDLISFSGIDLSYLFDQPHNLTGTKTFKQIVQQACSECLGSPNFDNTGNFDLYNTSIDTSKLDPKMTWKKLIGYICQITGYNAYIDNLEKLSFKWYDFSVFDSGLDGGTFDTNTTPYSDGDTADGGDFTFSETTNYDGGTFTDTQDYHIVQAYKNFQMGTYDISITGVRVINGDTVVEKLSTHTYEYEYIIEVKDNPLAEGIENTIANHLGNKINDTTFRVFSCSVLCNPLIEAGDMALVIDRKGIAHQTLVNEVVFQTGGFTQVACKAESIIRQKSSYVSEAAKAVAEANRNTARQLSIYDESVQRMNRLAQNSGGLYTARVIQQDGSVIYYESDHVITYDVSGNAVFTPHSFVCKDAGTGYFYSTDAGVDDEHTTWTGGMDRAGNAVLNTLALYKLTADWIVAGILTDKDNYNYWDLDNNIFRLSVTTTVGGKTVDTIAQEKANAAEQAAENTAAAALAAQVAIYDGEIADLQNQIDGNVTTWYYSGVPTLNNLPANQWTTTTDKDNHIGDIYYDSATGYAYRFMKDGNNYVWVKIADSDIEAALAEAQDAWDLADNKRRVFITQPVPPYDIGDLWVQGSNGDIKRCATAKTSTQAYNASDWVLASKYTDDSALTSWISGTYTTDKTNLQSQIDSKAETWYQSADPSSAWTTEALKNQHIGDLWYRTTDDTTWFYTKEGSTYKWVQQNVPTAVFDKIDGKAQIFTSQPVPPYNVGDLWCVGTTGDILTCVTARATGNYTAADWAKRNKYTDDTAVDDLDNNLDQDGVFNRLTNGDTAQGIVLVNNKLYINGQYIQAETLNANDIKAGVIADAAGKFSLNMTTGALTMNSGLFKGEINVNNNFLVNSSGDMTAKSGTIGNLTLGSGALYAYGIVNIAKQKTVTASSRGTISMRVIDFIPSRLGVASNFNLIFQYYVVTSYGRDMYAKILYWTGSYWAEVESQYLSPYNYSWTTVNFSTTFSYTSITRYRIVIQFVSTSSSSYRQRIVCKADTNNVVKTAISADGYIGKVNSVSSDIGGIHFEGGILSTYDNDSSLSDLDGFRVSGEDILLYDSGAPLFLYSQSNNGLQVTGHVTAYMDTDNYVMIENDGYVTYMKNGTSHSSIPWSSSDRRNKEDITVLDMKMSKALIDATDVYKFKYKNDEGHHYGVMAQDVREVLDSLGEYDSQLEYEMEDTEIPGSVNVAYQEYVPLLINYVKDLRTELNELKAELNKLKEEK